MLWVVYEACLLNLENCHTISEVQVVGQSVEEIDPLVAYHIRPTHGEVEKYDELPR
jgi:hypothetical protein